jgi:uncharacterized protein (TIGR03086 family)
VSTRPGPAEIESAGSVSALFADALEQAERVVARVTPDQFGLPTPCAEWDVQTLLGHLLAVVQRAERAADGRPVAAVPGVVAVDTRRWAAGFAAAASKAGHAWAAAGPAAVPAPWGLLPGPVVLSGFVLEVVAHTADLAVSTGSPEPLDPRLATAALRVAERLAPAALRSGGRAFADPVPAPPGADAYGRLAAFLGRTPR